MAAASTLVVLRAVQSEGSGVGRTRGDWTRHRYSPGSILPVDAATPQMGRMTALPFDVQSSAPRDFICPKSCSSSDSLASNRRPVYRHVCKQHLPVRRCGRADVHSHGVACWGPSRPSLCRPARFIYKPPPAYPGICGSTPSGEHPMVRVHKPTRDTLTAGPSS